MCALRRAPDGRENRFVQIVPRTVWIRSPKRSRGRVRDRDPTRRGVPLRCSTCAEGPESGSTLGACDRLVILGPRPPRRASVHDAMKHAEAMQQTVPDGGSTEALFVEDGTSSQRGNRRRDRRHLQRIRRNSVRRARPECASDGRPTQRDGGTQQFVDLRSRSGRPTIDDDTTWVGTPRPAATAFSWPGEPCSERTFARRVVAETGHATPVSDQQRSGGPQTLLERGDAASSRSRTAWVSTPPSYCASFPTRARSDPQATERFGPWRSPAA